ncbi:hypothetical protein BIV57_04440 [Mangrovactinospora gilvigrisea]|uniref:Uncharacterized protein n=1 Tax=Mangrovactinospora gilvigrisea TaxID=1428644 RepID=A0A1J7BJ82_9ACTN|nr:hypothetical protein [Mangrovactinospora gilvigrisea]OIV38645.1 hypothetical protein BIV57_04440 [Mangrovactinospora gilvigrisea]
MRTTTRRRSLKIAAATLIAAAGLSLTACSGTGTAGAHASGSTVAGVTTAQSGDTATATGTHDSHVQDAKAQAAPRSQARPATQTGTAGTTTSRAGSSYRTQHLADGVSVARIYDLGNQHYRADIVHDGDVLATIETGETDAGLDANDMFVTLTLDGQVHSWMGGGQQSPGTFHLAGGWTAKVTQVGELHYRAQIIGNDGVAATIDADQHDTGLDANGIYIVLSAGGIISAHA